MSPNGLRRGSDDAMNEYVKPQTGSYDVKRLRADFPILSKHIYGKPLVYLDNAASAQKPRVVIERLTEAYENEYDIVRIAHSRGIPVLIDGSQGAVHLDVDVRDIDADFYVFTGHKVYGPTGIGVLYGKREWLERLPPFNGGGEMIETVTMDSVTYNTPPHRFEAGTPPIVQAIGLGAALDSMDGV